jgi:hypothetical protein
MKTKTQKTLKEDNVNLALPVEIIQDLDRIAASRRTDVESIVYSYILDGIASDSLAARKMKFARRAHEKLGKGHPPPKTFEEIFPDLLY